MKLVSFNVNGIRAIMKKDFAVDMLNLKPDVLCLQETKATEEQVKEVLSDFAGYHIYANEADKKGYSGTAVLTKVKPLSVSYDIDHDSHDKEGRVIALEFEEFILVNVYVPNSGSDLKRLSYRQSWDRDFLNYIKKKEALKPVVVCGDFNVAHKEIDLARPKANYNKSAGFMQEEIDGMDAYTSSGLVDSFRLLHEDEVKYSWWSYRGGARFKNVGWRIDYFLVSKGFKDRVRSAEVHNDIMGSDHCPVSIDLK